jgi:hypothetical protein
MVGAMVQLDSFMAVRATRNASLQADPGTPARPLRAIFRPYDPCEASADAVAAEAMP